MNNAALRTRLLGSGRIEQPRNGTRTEDTNMRALKILALLVFVTASAFANTNISTISNKCLPASGGVGPYIDAIWQGPLNGKTCTVHGQLFGAVHNCNAQGCHTWGCITSTILEDYIVLPNHACDCYDDWAAVSSITIDNTCTPQTLQFAEDYTCD